MKRSVRGCVLVWGSLSGDAPCRLARSRRAVGPLNRSWAHLDFEGGRTALPPGAQLMRAGRRRCGALSVSVWAHDLCSCSTALGAWCGAKGPVCIRTGTCVEGPDWLISLEHALRHACVSTEYTYTADCTWVKCTCTGHGVCPRRRGVGRVFEGSGVVVGRSPRAVGQLNRAWAHQE